MGRISAMILTSLIMGRNPHHNSKYTMNPLKQMRISQLLLRPKTLLTNFLLCLEDRHHSANLHFSSVMARKHLGEEGTRPKYLHSSSLRTLPRMHQRQIPLKPAPDFPWTSLCPPWRERVLSHHRAVSPVHQCIWSLSTNHTLFHGR